MRIEVAADATWEPVSRAEAMLYARANTDEDIEDAVFDGLISSARTMAENECDISIPEKSLVLHLPCFPGAWGAVRLLLPPVQSVESVKYYDADDELQTLDPSLYTVSIIGTIGAWIRPASTQTWPIGLSARVDAVQIAYTAGWPSAAVVPQAIKDWMKIIISTMYDNRNAEQGGGVKLSYVDRLLDPFRMKEV